MLVALAISSNENMSALQWLICLLTSCAGLIADLIVALADSECRVSLPFEEEILKNVLLNTNGIIEGEQTMVLFCKRYSHDLKRSKLPRLALANSLYLGPVPDILANLTPIEESMIALCRAKVWIL